MNVLSLFDGMSCGRIALNRAGVEVNKYYASEVDKYAIQVSRDNWSDIEYIGDVKNVKGKDLEDIDLLIGGSPCQGFSFAGKQLNFDDPRSALFFEFVRLLEETNPRYFILENVMMREEYRNIITQYMHINPVVINSNRFSAQNRERLYWTNIPIKSLPDISDEVLDDILIDMDDNYEYLSAAKRGRYKKHGTGTYQKIESRGDKKANCITSVNTDSGCIMVGRAENLHGYDMIKRIYSKEGKSPTLTAVCGGHQEKKVAINDWKWRKLLPIEYERLQKVPDNYTSCVSDSQRYKMLGNGWTVDVISHILEGINE